MKKEIITGITFIGACIMMFGLVIAGKIMHDVEYARKRVTWNAADFYPLEGENENIEGWVTGLSKEIKNIEGMIEDYTTNAFRYRKPFILTKKEIDSFLGLDMETSLCAGKNDTALLDDIVVLYSDNSLGLVCDDIDLSKNLDNLIQFGQNMDLEGRNFLFFENPEKFIGTEIYADYSIEKYEQIQKAFDDNGLNIISAKELEGMYPSDISDMFYKTDHHWTAASGIWASGILCDYLNEQFGYGFDISLFDLSNYEIITYENLMLGSLGKKVTEVYIPAEEFQLYLPTYNTSLEVFISTQSDICIGNIQETLLDYSVFDTEDPYRVNLYQFYGYGDKSLIKIHNNNVTDGSHVLLVKTSFANCMYPYLAAVVQDLDIIDLRHFNGSLESYIQQTDPDTIVVICGITGFTYDSAFDFH